MRVIVAGAGLAGLTAARAAARAGAAVTVLEARDRLGGRVLTVRDGFADETHAELGGEFIDREQKAICTLCDELGVRLVRVLQSGFTHRYRGRDGAYHVSRTRPWNELKKLVAPLLQRYRSAGGRLDSDTVREIAAFSLRDWLRRQHATSEQHAMADALRGFFLADPDVLSVLPVVEQLATGGSPAQVEMYRIDGGNDRLVEALARDSDARLLLRHRVTAIAQSDDRVVVSVLDAVGVQQQIDGDAIVVTLPASTLADVTITPPLPADHADAIRSLRYGCATKVVLQTPIDPFRGRARAFATDTRLGAFWEGGSPRETRRGAGSYVLTFLGGGSTSRDLRERADRGAPALLADLCWLGMNGAPVETMRVRTWEDDPFARGGYAYFDPGFDPAKRELLARTAGRIVFAGEHTSRRWQGYMNGAVETGLRAAAELR
jgi:monoamine oxidase